MCGKIIQFHLVKVAKANEINGHDMEISQCFHKLENIATDGGNF